MQINVDANDNVYDTDPMLGGVNTTQGAGGLDPTPGAANAGQTLATPPAGFDNVSYHGAFEPGTALWLKGWTALEEKGYLP